MKAPPADFYEDDEDPEKIRAAFKAARYGLTTPIWGPTYDTYSTATLASTVTYIRTWP